jgi:hypothetical protein
MKTGLNLAPNLVAVKPIETPKLQPSCARVGAGRPHKAGAPTPVGAAPPPRKMGVAHGRAVRRVLLGKKWWINRRVCFPVDTHDGAQTPDIFL